jgi:uncharacterized protein
MAPFYRVHLYLNTYKGLIQRIARKRMEIRLKEVPKGVTIVQGFPGFGMVGTISTEYLRDKTSAHLIGTVKLEALSPLVAIHKGEIIPPISIYYDKGLNLVILSFLTKGKDLEWAFADIVKQLIVTLEAKEIISVEGVTSPIPIEKQQIFAYSNNQDTQKLLAEKGFEKLNDGIIMGLSAALLLEDLPCPLTAFFSMTSSTMPDSNAAAEIIKSLDSYLGLKIDYDPLYKQAEIFEEKIKAIMAQSQHAEGEKEKSMLNYMG